MSKKKSWIEKLEAKDKDLPKIVELDEKMQKRYKGSKTMVIPHPKDVFDIIARVPKGNLITTEEIREILAKKYSVDIACPMTTGIFVTIAMNAAEEMKQQNTNRIIPWWRCLRSKGKLDEKAPGGIEHQKLLLEQEGFSVIQKGNNYIVENFQNFVVPVV